MNRPSFPILNLLACLLCVLILGSAANAQAPNANLTSRQLRQMTGCCCQSKTIRLDPNGVPIPNICRCAAMGMQCQCPKNNNNGNGNGNSSNSGNSGSSASTANSGAGSQSVPTPSGGHSNPNGTGGGNSLADQEAAYEKSHPLTRLAEPPCHAPPGLATDHWVAHNIKISTEWRTETNFQPNRVAQSARAEGQAQATSAANAAGEVARDQAVSSIDYCSKFMINFSAEAGNRWNRIRNEIFLPIAVLLLLPGAVLTQVKAVVAAGSPVMGHVNPLEGIQRSLIAIVLIPGSYLVVNYGIDFSNSITHTIADEYHRIFGSDMYEDAICAEIRAFTPRHQAENDSSLKVPPFNATPMNHGIFSKIEADWGKLQDPSVRTNLAPRNRDDGAANANTVAKRLMLNASNAGLDTTWAILCAFQCAFMYYLFFVGPIMAALWAWPTKMLKDAFPNWVEGVITLCFWSFFWNTIIMLMACFKGSDDTGTIMMTALNFMASAAVKAAFDFAGLVKNAGQKAGQEAEKAGKQGGQSGSQSAGKAGNQGEEGAASSARQAAASHNPAPDEARQRSESAAQPARQSEPPAVPMSRTTENDEDDSASNDVTGRLLSFVPPPLSARRPKTMVAADGSITFLSAKEPGQYEADTTIDTATGNPVSKYKLTQDGRVAVYDPASGTYVVPTVTVQGKEQDKFRLESTIMQGYDATSAMYVDFNPLVNGDVSPPPSESHSAAASQAGARQATAGKLQLMGLAGPASDSEQPAVPQTSSNTPGGGSQDQSSSPYVPLAYTTATVQPPPILAASNNSQYQPADQSTAPVPARRTIQEPPADPNASQPSPPLLPPAAQSGPPTYALLASAQPVPADMAVEISAPPLEAVSYARPTVEIASADVSPYPQPAVPGVPDASTMVAGGDLLTGDPTYSQRNLAYAPEPVTASYAYPGTAPGHVPSTEAANPSIMVPQINPTVAPEPMAYARPVTNSYEEYTPALKTVSTTETVSMPTVVPLSIPANTNPSMPKHAIQQALIRVASLEHSADASANRAPTAFPKDSSPTIRLDNRTSLLQQAPPPVESADAVAPIVTPSVDRFQPPAAVPMVDRPRRQDVNTLMSKLAIAATDETPLCARQLDPSYQPGRALDANDSRKGLSALISPPPLEQSPDCESSSLILDSWFESTPSVK